MLTEKQHSQIVVSIQENEGFKSELYIDPIAKQKIPKYELEIIEKHWNNLNVTVGYGRCLQTNPLSMYEAEELLFSQVESIYIDLITNISFFDDLPINVQNVLVEMAYQLGINGLSKFRKTLRFLELKQYVLASKEMLISKWAQQTPNRAKKLSNLMKGDK
jgi:lysozyme